MEFLQQAKGIEEELIKIRRTLHMYPEVDFDLPKTRELIKNTLNKWEIENYDCGKSGICGIIKGRGENTIILRADMDALSINESKDKEYSSKIEGQMHACGHDAHVAILLGAAKLLNDNKKLLNGNVKLLFEAAEETTGGAQSMIEDGVLKDPKIKGVLALHVDENTEVGSIEVNRKVVNAASNPFKVTVLGKGGHGARPHATVDAVTITCNIITMLQQLVSRETSPTEPCVLSIGKINGGTAANAIPSVVTFEGIIRTMTPKHREYMKKRLEMVAKNTAQTMGGDAEVEIYESYPCLHNDVTLCSEFIEIAEEFLGKDNVKIKEEPSMGVESFAYFAEQKPSVFYFLGSRNEEKGITHAAHSCDFDVDEQCLRIGASLQAETAFRMLSNGEWKMENGK